MDKTIWMALQPFLAQAARDLLRTVGSCLAAHGYITTGGAGVETFIGAGMALAGLAWGWWTTSGYLQAASLLKKLTATHTPAQAVEVAKALPSASPAVGNFLVAAMVLSMFVANSSAFAQGAPRRFNLPIDPLHLNGTTVTGNPQKDLSALWQKIVAASTVDLTYAAALAGSAGTASSKVRKQCWDAIIALNEQANGANLRDASGNPMSKPDPHLFSDVEQLAEVVDNLSPQGPLFTSCAGAAELAKMNTLQFISAAIAGAASFAALP